MVCLAATGRRSKVREIRAIVLYINKKKIASVFATQFEGKMKRKFCTPDRQYLIGFFIFPHPSTALTRPWSRQRPLPALAKNSTVCCFLNASRPTGRGEGYLLLKCFVTKLIIAALLPALAKNAAL